MNTGLGCCNIGLVLLSSDLRVIGMSDSAKQVLGPAMKEFGHHVLKYHPRRSHQKIEGLLTELCTKGDDGPIAMIIDVLNKVLMINLYRIKTSETSLDTLYAMAFIDVSRQTEAEIDPRSGLVGLKKFPVCDRGSFLFLDAASIYFIKSEGNYSKIFTKDCSYFLHLSLKSILQRYTGPNFFRVHKSYIVNLDHVRKINKPDTGHSTIVFNRDGISPVPLARRRARELREALRVI